MLVIVAAVLGLSLAATGIVVGAQAYLHARPAERTALTRLTATQVQQRDYIATVRSWPYPMAPGDELPAEVPNPRHQTPTPDTDRTFVSFFYACSWEDVLLHGKKAQRAAAITALTAWNLLPETVTTVDASDGTWRAGVLDPAAAGDLTPLAQENNVDCEMYRRYRQPAGNGIALKRAAPSGTPTTVGAATLAGGRLTVTEQYGAYAIRFDAPDLASANPTVLAAFGESSLALCSNRTMRWDAPVTSAAGGTIALPLDGARWLDPSFLQFVALFPADTRTIDCTAHPPLATADIDWSKLPNRRPDLVIHDSGSATGARGQVTMAKKVPSIYSVAPGDNTTAIATRLGITADDLAFMTPWSPYVQDDHTLYAKDGFYIDPRRFRPDYGTSSDALGRNPARAEQ